MLENLDNIDWSELEDAYGQANNVPHLIRGLVSAEKELRQKARFDLSSHIIHQGTPYSSTVYAIPFLVELLQKPTIPDRETIASLLVFIAESCLYLQEDFVETAQTLEIKEQQADQLDHDRYKNAITGSWRVVTSFMPVYLNLLEGSDSQTQIQLQKLLKICQEI
jgi:hypothetical protein